MCWNGSEVMKHTITKSDVDKFNINARVIKNLGKPTGSFPENMLLVFLAWSYVRRLYGSSNQQYM